MPMRILTQQADDDRAAFHAQEYGGCSCFKAPPCSYCTHPGNPANQDEDDDCWVSDTGPVDWKKHNEGRKTLTLNRGKQK